VAAILAIRPCQTFVPARPLGPEVVFHASERKTDDRSRDRRYSDRGHQAEEGLGQIHCSTLHALVSMNISFPSIQARYVAELPQPPRRRLDACLT
jgi:hypothetical protein